jgi:Ser/Thr protein kinase RdoA (MazF antagonist)
MMPLTEIDALVATLDARGRSPVADVLAAAWAVPAGHALFWRSSASHVFLVTGEPRRYLRFVPEGTRSFASVDRVATLMATLADRGGPVARPLSSMRGKLAERVITPLGPMCATMAAAAAGAPIDVAELTGTIAHEWGAALARVHDLAAGISWPTEERYTDLARHFGPDDPLRAIVADVAAGLPDDSGRFGLIHGDFELDNIAWQGQRPTAYDFDEATRGWYAADVAYAVRDLAHDPSRVGTFLAGYRTIRPFDEVEEDSVPLFRRLNAARSVVTIEALLRDDPRPQDHHELIERLRHHAEVQRLVALAS